MIDLFCECVLCVECSFNEQGELMLEAEGRVLVRSGGEGSLALLACRTPTPAVSGMAIVLADSADVFELTAKVILLLVWVLG